jgi:hypothetical protein
LSEGVENENLEVDESVEEEEVLMKKREVKEERKLRVENYWKDFEIKQFQESFHKHGKNYDLLEQAVPTRTRL